jgi:hypothetical protein
MMVDDSFNANLYTWICGTIAQQLDSVVLLLFIYLFINFTIIQNYNNDWRYGQQDMSPMWRPTWYKPTSRHTLKTIDLSPYNKNFDLDKSRQKFHHSLKEHHKISNIPKFCCEML